MMKKILSIILCVLLVVSLAGCKIESVKDDSKTASSISETVKIPTKDVTSGENEDKKSDDITIKETTTESTEESTSVYETESQHAEKEITEKAKTPIDNKKAEVSTPQKGTETTTTTEEPKSETVPEKTTKKSTEDTTKSTEPKPSETPNAKPQKEAEFNINYWIAYAKSYAQSIGILLDNTAVDCWDNPISANPRRKSIESDIVSRLDRYKNVEGFTSVWIWAEKITETEYDIYIGYA